MNLTPRVNRIVITGGGSGIGYAAARAFLNEGSKVVITGRNGDKLKKAQENLIEDTSNKDIYIMQWDVRDIKKIDSKLAESAELLGGYFDGFINNAGIYPVTGVNQKALNETEEIWDDVMTTNLKAPVFLTRKAAEYFTSKSIKGNICNVASTTGAPERHIVSSYGASKNALIRMTRAMAEFFAPNGIILNGVAPGITSTELNRYKTGETKIHANGKIISAEEIASVIFFLMSKQGEIIIGDTIYADSGYFTNY